MAKIIELEVGNKTYKLEFNRRIILQMETDGFIGKEAEKLREKQPVEFVYKFINYAFKKNHADLPQKEIDAIVDEIGDLNGFVEALSELIKDCVQTIENKQGNARWGIK